MGASVGLQRSNSFRRRLQAAPGPEGLPTPCGPIQAKSNKVEQDPLLLGYEGSGFEKGCGSDNAPGVVPGLRLQVKATDRDIRGTDAAELEESCGKSPQDRWTKSRLVAISAVLGVILGSSTTTAAVWNSRHSDESAPPAGLGSSSVDHSSDAHSLKPRSTGSSKHGSPAPGPQGPAVSEHDEHSDQLKVVKHKNCMAHSEFHCLLDPECRWFSYMGSSSSEGDNCPHCEKWFGKSHAGVTGCRDWEPRTYCHDMIYAVAVRWKDSDPRAPWFSDALGLYQVTQSGMNPRSSPRKRMVCDVWCDGPEPGHCYGQPRVAGGKLHGVNYGGRFIPEQFLGLPGTDDVLFLGIDVPGKREKLSLCDVNTSDAGIRMVKFLNLNIKEEHFELMASFGFRVVRLPLGYWNVIEVPGGGTPTGPPEVVARWRALQEILPAAKYRKWIDQVFKFARFHGLKVLMDLHGAPGGQSGSQNTGCAVGKESTFHFPSVPAGVGWNTMLGVAAIEAMARICAEHGETCYGIELLNEPFDPGLGKHTRHHLQNFYHRAIRSARKHLDKDKPLIIFEWAARMWYWRHRRNWFTHEDYGRVMFSTHLFMYPNPPTVTQKAARDSFTAGIHAISEFALHTGYDVLVTEYALNSHGDGKKDDHFDYNSLTDWFIHQFEQFAMGSMVWNFDSFYPAWGPVAEAQVGSGKPVDWEKILKDRCRWETLNCTDEPWRVVDKLFTF